MHDWDLSARKLLLRKAYDALPDGGALIVQETFIDDTRRDRPHNLLSSLNMLIQTERGSEFTISEYMHPVAISQAGGASRDHGSASTTSALGPLLTRWRLLRQRSPRDTQRG